VPRSTDYVLGLVLFAVALFFAGMSAKVRRRGTRQALLAVGAVAFLGALAWIAVLPVSISVQAYPGQITLCGRCAGGDVFVP
jgi:hypothetical protein